MQLQKHQNLQIIGKFNESESEVRRTPTTSVIFVKNGKFSKNWGNMDKQFQSCFKPLF